MKKTVLILICVGIMACFIPLQGRAFEKFTCGEQEISIWGFLRNNTSMFTQNPNPWGPTAGQSGNQLAMEQTWLRASMDWKINSQFRFWLQGQFMYEPWLPVEQGANVMHNGNEYSAYKNVNDILREVYLEWTPNKATSIKFGRMNVIWGETITGRVGDIVNPADYRWASPFSMEDPNDQRIPQYMIRGVHSFDSISSSFEWIISPTITSPEWSVVRADDQSANIVAGNAGQRFSSAPETNFYPYRAVGNIAMGPPFDDVNALSAGPMNGAWSFDPLWANIVTGGNPGSLWVPFTFATVPGTGGAQMPVSEGAPNVTVKYPQHWDSTRGGFRTNTTAGGFNFGFIYYHRQQLDAPVMKRGPISNFAFGPSGLTLTREYTVEWPDVDNFGFYMNKQLPWPGVIRTEVIYTPNMSFNYFVPTAQPFSTESGVVKREQYQYLFAYDLSGFFYPSWHNTASIDVSLEHVGTWIPNARELQNQGIGTWYGTKLPSWRGTFSANIYTNWLYNKFYTGLGLGYDTFGGGIMIVPQVKWTPGWQNDKFSAQLKYVYSDGDRDKSIFGTLKDKSYIQLQTQLNF